MGKKHNGAIVSMVERHAKLTLLAQVSRKKAHEVGKALKSKLGSTVYFVRPYRSWERGSNGPINGLIRQFMGARSNLTQSTRKNLIIRQDQKKHQFD